MGCKGPGIDRPTLGKQNSFSVDCSRAGNNVLFVGIYGPEKPCDEVYVKHQGEGSMECLTSSLIRDNTFSTSSGETIMLWGLPSMLRFNIILFQFYQLGREPYWRNL